VCPAMSIGQVVKTNPQAIVSITKVQCNLLMCMGDLFGWL
jgi:hypothetical protein